MRLDFLRMRAGQPESPNLQVWRMPLDTVYHESLKSNFADGPGFLQAGVEVKPGPDPARSTPGARRSLVRVHGSA